jgi:hypothetical protein
MLFGIAGCILAAPVALAIQAYLQCCTKSLQVENEASSEQARRGR